MLSLSVLVVVATAVVVVVVAVAVSDAVDVPDGGIFMPVMYVGCSWLWLLFLVTYSMVSIVVDVQMLSCVRFVCG